MTKGNTRSLDFARDDEIEGDELFGVEVEDDEFFGFFGVGFPFAAADGVQGGLRENGVAAEHRDRLHVSVGSDDGLDPNGSGEVHVVSELRVEGYDLGSHLAMAFR